MSKKAASAKSVETKNPTSENPPETARLKWPEHYVDLPKKPRVFRIHRLNGYEWQAYVADENGELPIGKPDLFDIVCHRVKSLMRAEGQQDFIAKKKRDQEAQEKAFAEQNKAQNAS